MKQFLIILLGIVITNTATAQNVLNNVGLSASTPAVSAYSLRLLSSSYTGYAIQVTRSSDNAVQNIGFTVNGDLDVTALTTFVGASNGYVSIWYDQSNSNNAQGITAPLIVNAGTVNTSNSYPSILFNGGNTFMYTTLPSLQNGTPHTLNSVAAATTGAIVALSSTQGASATNKNSVLGAGFSNNGSAWYGGFNQNGTYAAGSTNSSLSIRSKIYSSNNIVGYFNGPKIFSTSVTYNLTSSDILIGSQNYNKNQFLNGSVSEVLVFTSALSTSARRTLEKNQGAYYNILITKELLGIYGSVAIASSNYINKNGALGASGLTSNGENVLNTPILAATTAVSSIASNTATSGGNVISDGGDPITSRGVCWSTVTGPTITSSKTIDPGTTGSFISNLTGLATITTYYVRAYATNSVGTSYGTEVSFTTTP